MRFALVGFAVGYTLDAVKDDLERKLNIEFIPYSSLEGRYFLAVGFALFFLLMYHAKSVKKIQIENIE